MPATSVKSPQPGPEIFIALVGAVGTDLDAVSVAVGKAVRAVRYTPTLVKISDLLDEVEPDSVADWPDLSDATYDGRISTRMTAGDKFREALERGDALAMFAVLKIRSARRELEGGGISRRAYILRSLKHPDEVAFLREVYGDNFFVISAYSPQRTRIDFLAKELARDRRIEDPEEFEAIALELVRRDKLEDDLPMGQHLRDTFPKADFFVDASIPNGKTEDLEREATRFIEIIFGHPYHTPTPGEHAMFHAQAAALRTAALGRQVGAALMNDAGEILAVGSNEVPKAFGGQYWPEDPNDNRDFRRQRDDSNEMKELVAAQILERLRGAEGREGWLIREDITTDEFVTRIKGTRAQALIEFERAVHAEMAAILDAARRGQTVRGASLHSTTFPCHECTRHIIGAGIRRVVYIDPYPKSLALQLHDDAIVRDPEEAPADKIPFEPFVGVAPRRYLELFTYASRRDELTGERLPAEPGEVPKGLRPLRPNEAEEGDALTCEGCGHDNPAAALFCNACGNQLDQTASRTEDTTETRPDTPQGQKPEVPPADSKGAREEKDPAESERMLSDPVIRFQEVWFVTEFQNVLGEKQVRLKEEADDGQSRVGEQGDSARGQGG